MAKWFLICVPNKTDDGECDSDDHIRGSLENEFENYHMQQIYGPIGLLSSAVGWDALELEKEIDS